MAGGTPRYRARFETRDRTLHARALTFSVTTAPTMMHVVRARWREMELSPTQKASSLGRGGIATLLGSHKARIIKRFFRADEFALMCG